MLDSDSNFDSISDMMWEGYRIAKEHGFWDNPDIIRELALIHTEVSECVEEVRRDKPYQIMTMNDKGKPEGLPSELADIIIRTLNICAHYDIDIHTAIETKMKYNDSREYKHGKKF